MTELLRRVAGAFVAPEEGPEAVAVAPPEAPSEPAPLGPAWHLRPARSASCSVTAAARVRPPALPQPAPVPDAAGPPAEPTSRAAARPAKAAVAVVCNTRETALAGAAVALALVERHRSRCAVVLEWTGQVDQRLVPRPAAPSARRQAAGLAALEIDAVPAGRLVRVALPCSESAAVAAARRAAAAVDVPVVLAVGGPRGRTLEALLADQDAILLVTRPDADTLLVELAAGELQALAPPVATLSVPPSPVAAALARAGIALAAPLRAPVLALV